MYRLAICLFFLSLVTPVKSEDVPALKKQDWSWQGPFGTFDRAQLQRGFQVYKQVCSTCHSMNLLSYRDLAFLYSGDSRREEIVKAIAREYRVADINDEGQAIERPAEPSDHFVPPYPNEKAGRAANNGAYPVDLSLITKARPSGADYVYSLLTGYRDAPQGVKVPEGMHYNEVFPGHFIAMPSPLSEGLVTYEKGQPEPTVDQMARDVTAFLSWASEPELEDRKQTGFVVMLYLAILTVLLYVCQKRIWARARLD